MKNLMPKLKHETDQQYIYRTSYRDVWGTVSGSTTATGILGVTHSMGVIPSFGTMTYHGDNPYVVTITSLTSNYVDFKFWKTIPSGSVLVSTAVTASYHLKV